MIFLKVVPTCDPVFRLVSLLVDIINLLMCFTFDLNTISILETLINDFLFCCSEFSSNNEIVITIKFHHLVHIPRLITKFGPPRFFSTLNFEQHNHFLKGLILTSSNWINPIETICNKYAQNSCILKDQLPVETKKIQYFGILPNELSERYSSDSEIFTLGSVNINNIKYTALKSVIFLGKNDYDVLKFMLIEKIFKCNINYYFYGQLYEGIHSDYNEINLFCLNTNFCIDHSLLKPNFSSYSLYKNNSNSYIVPYHWL